MLTKFYIFITCFVTLSLFIDCETPKIEVFVESLCPDCQDFIGKSFASFLNNPDHASLAEVKFYPYGNAHETKNGDHFEFSCQHGPNECYGNVVEVCGLNKLDYETGLRFMVCMEEGIVKYDKYINKALIHCINDQELLKNILDCATGIEGNLLQHEVAHATPVDHKYVPWIVFNDTHDTQIEAKILDNMTEFLCGLDQNKDSPACQGVIEVDYKNFNVLTQRCLNPHIAMDNFLN